MILVAFFAIAGVNVACANPWALPDQQGNAGGNAQGSFSFGFGGNTQKAPPAKPTVPPQQYGQYPPLPGETTPAPEPKPAPQRAPAARQVVPYMPVQPYGLVQPYGTGQPFGYGMSPFGGYNSFGFGAMPGFGFNFGFGFPGGFVAPGPVYPGYPNPYGAYGYQLYQPPAKSK